MSQRLQAGNEHGIKAQNVLLKKEVKQLQNLLSNVPDISNKMHRLQSYFNHVIQQNELLQRENQLLKNQISALQYAETLLQEDAGQTSMARALEELRIENQQLREQIEILENKNMQTEEIDYFAGPELDADLSKSVVMTGGHSKREVSDFKSTFGLSSQEENDPTVMGLNDV